MGHRLKQGSVRQRTFVIALYSSGMPEKTDNVAMLQSAKDCPFGRLKALERSVFRAASPVSCEEVRPGVRTLHPARQQEPEIGITGVVGERGGDFQDGPVTRI